MYICKHMYVCMYVYLYIKVGCMYVCMYICMYVWKNSAKNCRSYNSFNGICSDRSIITADIKPSLSANK